MSVTKTEAELDAMSTEELRQFAIQEMLEAEAAEKAAAEKEIADKAAAEAAAVETPEQITARELAEKAAAEQEAAEQEVAAKAAAEAEAEVAKKTEQERDEQGRFVKKEEKVEEPVVQEVEPEDEGEPEEWVIRREVDLGDGTGVQVFAGRGLTELDAIKDLNDKLVTAQTNATRELRNIQKKHPKEPEQPKEPVISDDLEFVFKEQLGKKPSEAFKAMFKEVTGVDVTEFKTSHAAFKAWQESTQATERSLAIQRDWVATHPEYITSVENGDQIRNWVQNHNYNEFTQENLEKAFEDLSERGLLKLKTDEASVPTKPEVKVPARIEPPVTEVPPVRSPKKASSVSSTRSAAPVITTKTEPTEDELYDSAKYTTEQIKQMAEKYLASARQ